MVGHGGSSAGSYLTDPTSPIPSHCASIVTTSTVRVKLSGMNGFWRTDVMHLAVAAASLNFHVAAITHKEFHRFL